MARRELHKRLRRRLPRRRRRQSRPSPPALHPPVQVGDALVQKFKFGFTVEKDDEYLRRVDMAADADDSIPMPDTAGKPVTCVGWGGGRLLAGAGLPAARSRGLTPPAAAATAAERVAGGHAVGGTHRPPAAHLAAAPSPCSLPSRQGV